MKVNKKKISFYFAITISPPVVQTGMTSCEPDYCTFYQEIPKFLNKYSDHYIIYPEYTDFGRLHYHGIIRVFDKMKFYKTKHLLWKWGFCCIKPLKTFKDLLTWLVYCRKEWGYSEDQPVIYRSLSRAKKLKRAIETLEKQEDENERNQKLINYMFHVKKEAPASAFLPDVEYELRDEPPTPSSEELTEDLKEAEDRGTPEWLNYSMSDDGV